MIKYFLCVLIIFSSLFALVACDGSEQPFIVNNTLRKAIVFQIWQGLPKGFPEPTVSLPIGREGETYQPSLQLTPGETSKIFTAGVIGSRIGYIIIISEETGKESFRRRFTRDELVKYKFKLKVTETGIEYSP